VTADDGDGPGRATVQAVSIAAATCKYRSLVEFSSDLIWSAAEAVQARIRVLENTIPPSTLRK
jgi:hypothetical protein